MDWKEVGKKLLNIGVPILGTALGGPVGGIAAKAAISLISSKVGIEEDVLTPDNVMAFASNTEGLIKLKEIELNHGLEIERLYIDDLKSAREREVEVTKATGSKDYFMYILASLIVAGFFILTGLLMYHKIPTDSNEVVFLLFGGLIAGFERVCSYFFGSSKSSAEKTKLIAMK